MTTPDALREKVARALYEQHASATSGIPYDILLTSLQLHWKDVADAAIRVVVEACAEVAEGRLGVPHEWTNCQAEMDLMDAEARSIAQRIRALLPKDTP